MGRMFRIITEHGNEPADPPEPREPAENVPYVEVGGPDGVVSSIPPAAPRIRALPLPEPETVRIAAEDPAPEANVLSVAFHRFPKTNLRLMPSGVAPDVVAFHFPDHPVSVEYRAVRDEIRRQFEESGPRVVLFTAAAPVCGTTTVLLNTAASLVHDHGTKVLIVDANPARPTLARRLGVNDSPGLSDVLAQTVPVAWAIQPTAVANLHVLAAGGPGDGTPPAAGADFPRLLAQLRQWFDWVLVDGGVWDDASPRSGLGAAADAVYLVARQGEIDRPEFAGLRSTIASAGGLLRGYITTRP